MNVSVIKKTLMSYLPMHSVSVLLVVLFLGACGFSPVYQVGEAGDAASGQGALAQQLAAVDVPVLTTSRAEQIMSVELARILNPRHATAPKQTRIAVEFTQKREALAITNTRTITRYNLVVTGKFTLVDVKTGDVLMNDKSLITSSYDATTSDFATYSVEQDTLRRIMTELAEDIRFKLITHFSAK